MMKTTFKERLKILRKQNDLTQMMISAQLSIAIRQYQRYEAGDSEPTLSVLLRLADFFDVSLDYLAGRSDAPERR